MATRQGEKVLLDGVGKYNRADRLEKVESVEHVTLLDPLDFQSQLEELRTLKDGWYDGQGVAPPADGAGLARRRDSATIIPMPSRCLCLPGRRGSVRLEWPFARKDVSLEIDLRRAEPANGIACDLDTDDEEARSFNLNAGWRLGLDGGTAPGPERSRIMTEETLLLRQINPTFIKLGRVTSAAFRPTPKDQQKLSVYDGDKITAAASFVALSRAELESVGVLAVTVGESHRPGSAGQVQPRRLPRARRDRLHRPRGQPCEKKGKQLRDLAETLAAGCRQE